MNQNRTLTTARLVLFMDASHEPAVPAAAASSAWSAGRDGSERPTQHQTGVLGRVQGQLGSGLRVEEQGVDLAPDERVGHVADSRRDRRAGAEAVPEQVCVLQSPSDHLREQRLADRLLQSRVAAVLRPGPGVRLDNRRGGVREALEDDGA